ncbi:hypothetical protein N0V90_011221 [Kalmusia sp. IMI 367209]|nr:hypothetical protein N0V90_011221 [Kalmusia sp. IMI 367209]
MAKDISDALDDEHSTVRIISSTSPNLHNGPSDLRDILCASCSGFRGHRTLLQVCGNGAFLIWTHEAFEPASWTFDEAQTYLEQHLRQSRVEAAVILCNVNDSVNENTAQHKTFMISILSINAESANSITIPYQDRQALQESPYGGISRRPTVEKYRSYIKKNLAFIIAALILVVMGIALAATLHQPTPNTNIWLSWNLPKDSKGPQNQLQFTWPHPNFTAWAAENDRSVDDFYLRLDDQTMIPTEYVDEFELQYQAWYAKYYPWFAEVGDSKSYLNESYWRDTRSYPLAIDHEFHVAHCVLTMKRYWKARESGHHVCPRDIDHNHISHCFGVLESYAFDVSWRRPERELLGHYDSLILIGSRDLKHITVWIHKLMVRP